MKRVPFPMEAARGWVYVAVSSEQQAFTLEHQERWARQTATEKGWRISASSAEGVKG